MCSLTLKSWVGLLCFVLLLSAAACAAFFYYLDALLPAAMAGLSAIFIGLQWQKLVQSSVVIKDRGFIHAGRLIPYDSVRAIDCVCQARIFGGAMLHSLLGDSAIYIIQTDTRRLQLFGMFYNNIDPVMTQLARAATVEITQS